MSTTTNNDLHPTHVTNISWATVLGPADDSEQKDKSLHSWGEGEGVW